ncbi:MAG: N-acetylmuramoyl-L-alanine amidase, partial [Maricaulaceae bacterium]
RVVVDSSQPIAPEVFTLAEQSPRLVIDFARADFEVSARPIADGQAVGAGAGLVERFRVAQFSPTRSRIVLDLNGPARVMRSFALDPAPGAASYRYVVDLAPTDQASFEAGAGFPFDRARTEPDHRASPASGARFVVVVDPGHGGRDGGATSARGTREKDVNLQLGRAIRSALEATGRYDVVMTRDDDRFIELQDRVRIARQAGADLFLSIHADSGPTNSSARGAAVYTLSDSAESRTRNEILSEDPWLVDVDLSGRRSEVGDIIIDLVHRVTRNESTAFAEILIPHLAEVGPMLRNSHRQRGFYVLLAPDVPAVLLEAGFLTNREDESRLTSSADRERLAEAVTSGIDTYFDQRERLYADGGAR